jgi:hypothetical protein
MKTRKLNTQKKIQKFITIQKLKINDLLQIRGGKGTTEEHKII